MLPVVTEPGVYCLIVSLAQRQNLKQFVYRSLAGGYFTACSANAKLQTVGSHTCDRLSPNAILLVMIIIQYLHFQCEVWGVT